MRQSRWSGLGRRLAEWLFFTPRMSPQSYARLGVHSKGYTGMKLKSVPAFRHLESKKITLGQTGVQSILN